MVSRRPGWRSAIRPNAGKRVCGEDRYRDGVFFRRCPKPVERAVQKPAFRGIFQEQIAQAQHARLVPPSGDPGGRAFGIVQRQVAHDREAAWVILDGLKGQLG